MTDDEFQMTDYPNRRYAPKSSHRLALQKNIVAAITIRNSQFSNLTANFKKNYVILSMSDLLQLVVSEGCVRPAHPAWSVPPVIRVHGILRTVSKLARVLRPEDTEELMRSIPRRTFKARERGGADFGFAFGEVARFRVSVFKEKGNFAMVLRQIPSKLLTFEQIGIPPVAKELLYKPRGLVLVTGPTGSSKVTLASIDDQHHQRGTRRGAHHHRRKTRLEVLSPKHKKKRSITQREIGVDVPNFCRGALRRALRPGSGHRAGR